MPVLGPGVRHTSLICFFVKLSQPGHHLEIVILLISVQLGQQVVAILVCSRADLAHHTVSWLIMSKLNINRFSRQERGEIIISPSPPPRRTSQTQTSRAGSGVGRSWVAPGAEGRGPGW